MALPFVLLQRSKTKATQQAAQRCIYYSLLEQAASKQESSYLDAAFLVVCNSSLVMNFYDKDYYLSVYSARQDFTHYPLTLDFQCLYFDTYALKYHYKNIVKRLKKQTKNKHLYLHRKSFVINQLQTCFLKDA